MKIELDTFRTKTGTLNERIQRTTGLPRAEQLTAGMVFSVEPGVYIEGNYGIRIEDLVRLTYTSIQVMSRSPKTMTVL
jgi:Xaa-Pro aminopeptidase